MRVGYCRVSKDDQDLSLQKDALKAAGCGRIFAEKISGAKSDRSELQAALEFAREGDTLVVWKLDRLGRSLSQLVNTIDRLKAEGIQFRCLSPEMDTTTASGKLIFGIFATLAEFERDLIRERTIAGLEAAAARGRKGGRPRSLSQEKIELAANMIKDGKTVSHVARTLDVSRQSVYRNVPVLSGMAENVKSARN